MIRLTLTTILFFDKIRFRLLARESNVQSKPCKIGHGSLPPLVVALKSPDM